MALKLINIIAFMVMIALNYMANALPLGGKTTGELSAQYPNLFVPAGITFSIWGIIYILLLGFIILQFMTENKAMVDAIGWLFVVSCILNALWIVFWHYQHLFLSLTVMLLLLATLIIINYRLIPHPGVITRAAFGIYLGWICIATIANATALLVWVGWQGWGISAEWWAAAMVFAGTAVTVILLGYFRNPFTGIAVLWALAGIIAARSWPAHRFVIIAAVISLVALGIITAVIAFRKQAIS